MNESTSPLEREISALVRLLDPVDLEIYNYRCSEMLPDDLQGRWDFLTDLLSSEVQAMTSEERASRYLDPGIIDHVLRLVPIRHPIDPERVMYVEKPTKASADLLARRAKARLRILAVIADNKAKDQQKLAQRSAAALLEQSAQVGKLLKNLTTGVEKSIQVAQEATEKLAQLENAALDLAKKNSTSHDQPQTFISSEEPQLTTYIGAHPSMWKSTKQLALLAFLLRHDSRNYQVKEIAEYCGQAGQRSTIKSNLRVLNIEKWASIDGKDGGRLTDLGRRESAKLTKKFVLSCKCEVCAGRSSSFSSR